jgi:virulence-associated protein VagC
MVHQPKHVDSPGRQAVRLPRAKRLTSQTEVLIRRTQNGVILQADRTTFTRRFMALAGSAKDFPYPAEPAPFDQLVVDNSR